MKQLIFFSTVLLFLFFCSSKRINTTDMEMSLPKGSFGWFWTSLPERGQIVLLKNPLDKNQQRLLRIIATEGQTVSFHNGSFIVDGTRINQTDMGVYDSEHRIFEESIWLENKQYRWLIKVFNKVPGWNLKEIEIPQGKIFVACDNRNACLDSRWWGSISTNSIESTLRFQMTKPDSLHSFFHFYPSKE